MHLLNVLQITNHNVRMRVIANQHFLIMLHEMLYIIGVFRIQNNTSVTLPVAVMHNINIEYP